MERLLEVRNLSKGYRFGQTDISVFFSKTLAARFAVAVGDAIEIKRRDATHRFQVIEIADDVGYFVQGRSYIDEKSYAVFSDRNPLFADNLEQTPGEFAVVPIGNASAGKARSAARLSSTYYFLGMDGLNNSGFARSTGIS